MKEAIELAIEGGYKQASFSFKYWEEMSFEEQKGIENTVLLDPLFWQALGEMLGWNFRSDDKQPWKKEWHRFIDHLAEGKDAESFFINLLKP